jgi:hypothetical protein
MNDRLATPFRVLQLAIGLAATLAGLDKFFNILANWGSYVSPLAARLLPFSVGTFMGIVGVVEIAVGVSILAAAPRKGAYVASAWLLLVAANLAMGGHFDIAVRDVVMSIAAFTVARALEVRETAAARSPIAASRVPGAVTSGLALIIAVGALHTASASGVPAEPQHHNSGAVSAASAPAALRQDMRKLWTDHVIWTREYIVAAVGDQPDASVAALLKEHISIAVDIIKYAKAGDHASQQQADAKWHRNGEDIADFLSKANANWPRATLVHMMDMHLATTTDEVVARLTKNWDADTRAFDAVFEHILMMSDALSDGIVKQFPEKFAGEPAGPTFDF